MSHSSVVDVQLCRTLFIKYNKSRKRKTLLNLYVSMQISMSRGCELILVLYYTIVLFTGAILPTDFFRK